MAIDTWKYDIQTWYPEEAAPFLGNGYIGGTIPIDGHGASGNPYFANLAAFYVGLDELMAPIPHWLNAPLTVDGLPIKPSWAGFRKILNLHDGTLFTAYNDEAGQVRVETQTFCHRGIGPLSAYQITITALKDVEIDLSPRLTIPSQDPRPTTHPFETSGIHGWVLDYGDPAAHAAQAMVIHGTGPLQSRQINRSEELGQCFRGKLQSGEHLIVDVMVVSVRGSHPETEAALIAKQSESQGYEGIRSTHVEAMSLLWQQFRFEAQDPYLERKVRAQMFYLTSTFRADVVWGGCATGLSSKVSWAGCIFWDTEFYLFPSLLLFYPDMARSILMYRHGTLNGARQNALDKGEKGARFAWQSRATGKDYAGMFSDERHVTADIAYCTWWYSHSAGDDSFLQGPGLDLLIETARNWASRATFNPSEQRWEIHGVIPADEHVMDHYVHAPINNSVMTNAYARWNLRMAARIARNVPQKEKDLWNKIADGIYLPKDDANGIYAEYEGYNGHPIKQADVGHLFFPLMDFSDNAEIRRNIHYYADRERETGLTLTHSPGVYASALSRTGDVEGVERFLNLSAITFVGPFELPRESAYGGSPVITGSGSFLMLVLYGLLGIDNFGDQLSAHPCIPKGVGWIKASGVYFSGRRYSVQAHPGQPAIIQPTH